MESIEVIYSASVGEIDARILPWVKNETLIQAINRSGLLVQYSQIDWSTHKLSIYGKRASQDDLVNPDDRIEILRPLSVDPKTARRLRAQKQAGI